MEWNEKEQQKQEPNYTECEKNLLTKSHVKMGTYTERERERGKGKISVKNPA